MKLVLVVMAVALLLTGCAKVYTDYEGGGWYGAFPSGAHYYQSPGTAD